MFKVNNCEVHVKDHLQISRLVLRELEWTSTPAEIIRKPLENLLIQLVRNSFYSYWNAQVQQPANIYLFKIVIETPGKGVDYVQS